MMIKVLNQGHKWELLNKASYFLSSMIIKLVQIKLG